MKKNIITITLLLFSAFAYSQNWIWFNRGGGNKQDEGKSVAVALDGTIFCTGSIQAGNSQFDSIQLSSVGDWNTFVCTYSPDGSLINATATSGNTGIGGTLLSSGIKNTEQENYFINTFVSGGAFFDTVYVNVIQSVLAKYNNNARCLWVKPIDYRIQYSGMAMDGGYIYAQGGFGGGGGNPVVDNFTLDTANGGSFIARFDTSGNCLWVKQAKTNTFQPQFRFAKNGRIYSVGLSASTLDYDTLHVLFPDTTHFNYVLQLDTGGRIKSYGILYDAGVRAVSADIKNNYYVSGLFINRTVIGNDTLYNNIASLDAFIAKFDSTGVFQWVKQLCSSSEIYVTASVTDDVGNTYLTGYFKGSAVFGSDTVNVGNTISTFIARYDTNGNLIGVKMLPNAMGNALALDNNGNVIITGAFISGVDFGTGAWTTLGGTDFFVAKLGAITGITTSIDDERLVIYPNPNQKLFTIEVPQSIIQANSAMLDIYDNIGNVVQRGTVDITNGKVQVDIGNVQKGIYNVMLSTSKKKFTGRVVVE